MDPKKASDLIQSLFTPALGPGFDPVSGLVSFLSNRPYQPVSVATPQSTLYSSLGLNSLGFATPSKTAPASQVSGGEKIPTYSAGIGALSPGGKWVYTGKGLTGWEQNTGQTVDKGTSDQTTTDNTNQLAKGQITNYDELVSQFPGYAGWDPTAAMADYKATGGQGKGAPTSTGIQPADLQAMTQQAIEASRPYYEALLKQAGGDLQGAVQLMAGDYSRGVRWAKDDLARQSQQQVDTLQNTLKQAGLENLVAQRSAIDALNQRGMATGQMTSPTGFQALSPSTEQYNLPSMNMGTFNPNLGSVGFGNPAASAAVGRGATELGLLQQDQQLRQEANMRATNQTLQNLGVTAQKATNPAFQGKSFQDILNAPPGTYGSLESNLASGYTQAEQAFRNTAQQAARDQYTQAANTAAQAAALGARTVGAETGYQALQNQIGDFVKNQVTQAQSGATV